ncbi:hypothetical protein BASA81_017163 [Batrachochytrium salamandrivorans]|nr:hypothetical protein BASA81_017163 [Batrachochytrium salamandrivorans]
MSPRKAPGDDGIIHCVSTKRHSTMPANTQEGVPPTPFARALLRKDGDPLNPGDKRGIALINVGLKLVCKVLQMRIERFVETNNLLSYEQAGFRKREEHSIQSPVGALLWKLQNMGFPRRTLAFLKALYTSSSARARAGSLLSDPFRPWTTARHETPSEDSCTQTMWQSLLTLSNHCWLQSTAIEQWANQWEMQFGVAKCGIISFTGHLAPRLDNPLDIRLHGQLVSRVESYKYLGVLIDSKLDHSAWLKQKRSALEHTIRLFTQCWLITS